jgi:hypothetical protein
MTSIGGVVNPAYFFALTLSSRGAGELNCASIVKVIEQNFFQLDTKNLF